jgi:asparagine synthase (glutamine-hydrolysing)
MWGVAIYDNRAQGRPVVHLARDRVGIKPIYFTRTTIGEWLFASEIRALLAHPHVPAEMDPLAFWHYLTFIVAPAPLTMFRGIFKLPPATIVRSITPVRGLQRYWDCKPRTFSKG